MGRNAVLSVWIKDNLQTLSKAESRVARTLLADYPLVGLESVATLAARSGTSGPTVLRFVNRMGFDSYRAFQQALRNEISERLNGPLSRYWHVSAAAKATQKKTGKRIAQALCTNIRHAVTMLPEEEYEAIVDLLCDRRKQVHLLGGRFSHMIADYFHRYLHELRPKTSLAPRNSTERPDYLLNVKKNDVVVALDFRRYQEDIAVFAQQASQQGATVVLMTDVWRSPAALYAEYVVCCPVEIPSPFDSGVSALSMVEVLSVGVAGKLGADAKRRMKQLEALRQPFKQDAREDGVGAP